MLSTTLDDLHEQMQSCEQAPGLNMLQHGELVHSEYIKLIEQLEANSNEYAELHALYAKLTNKLPPPDVLRKYHVYHDCGKHLCLEIGEDGKRRYPNHAECSAQQYSKLFSEDGFTTQLIRMDMDFHILRGEDLLKLCRSPFAPILYFTAWAEVNANASMFGGKDSESYKIKRSRLIQAGKKLLNT